MKKITFNDFRYITVASSIKYYKEVLVSFTANGKHMHQVIFLEEKGGASSATYLKAAKQEIERQIKNNELMKKSKKTINNTKKPLVIALTAAVAIGAVVGTYFITRHYIGGDTPAPVATGYTVLLLAGDGQFKNGDSFLVLENVKEGTKLADIDDYETPVMSGKNFDHWEWGENNKVYQDTLVKQNLYLTAKYIDNADVEREQAIKDIKAELVIYESDERIVDNLPKQEGIAIISDVSLKVLEDQTANISNVEQVEAIKSLTIDAIESIAECKGDDEEIATQVEIIKDVFSQVIKDGIAPNLNAQQSAATLNLSTSYLKAKLGDLYNESAIDGFFDVLKEIINSLTNPEDGNKLDVIRLIASGIMENAVLISKSDTRTIDMFGKFILDKVNAIIDRGYEKDATISLGDLLGKFFLAISKTSDDEGIKFLETYYSKVEEYFHDSIFDLAKKPQSSYLYQLGLEGMNALYSLNNNPTGELNFELATGGILDLIGAFDNNFANILAKGESKLAKCFDMVKNVCKSAAHVTDKNVFEKLIAFICSVFSPEFVEDNWDIVSKTTETLVRFPDARKAYALGISISDVLDAYQEMNNNLGNVVGELGIRHYKNLYSAIIESTQYSNFYAKRASHGLFGGLFSHLDEMLSIILQGGATTKINNAVGTIAGSLVGTSAFIGNRTLAGLGSISEIMGSINNYYKQYVITSLTNLTTNIDQQGTLGNKFQKFLSLSIKCYYAAAQGDETTKLFQGLYAHIWLIANSFKNLEPANNFLDMLIAYYGTEELFYNYPTLPSPVEEAKRVYNRVNELETKGVTKFFCNNGYAESGKFSTIFATMNTYFYSKIKGNINLPIEKIIELYNVTVEEVEKIK